MAITQSITSSFKFEVLQGIHNLAVGGDTFKLALYVGGYPAEINSSTPAYTSVGEVTGTGYTAGGITLTNLGVAVAGTIAYASWAPAIWTGGVFQAAGGLIYNASKGNRSVAVLNFGGTYSFNGAVPAQVNFPPFTNVTAPIIFN